MFAPSGSQLTVRTKRKRTKCGVGGVSRQMMLSMECNGAPLIRRTKSVRGQDLITGGTLMQGHRRTV